MEYLESKIPIIRKKDLTLTEKESKPLLEAYSALNYFYLCNLDGNYYHWKEIYDDTIINELLGKIISQYFKDDQLESKIVKDENDIYYLLTDNFIETGKKYSLFYQGLFPKIELDKNCRLDLFNIDLLDQINSDGKILKTDKQDLINIKYSLKMMIISDFIRRQSDRWYQNFLIQYHDNNCRLMPLYDFEYSFLEYEESLENSFKFDLTDKTVINYVRNDEQFQELLHLAMDLNMKKVFERLFDEYPIRINHGEILLYENIIKEKKEEIKKYKLIK